MLQNAAFILIGIGVLALIGWGARTFFVAEEISLIIKIAVGAIAIGILVLIGMALKERLSKAKTDDFREVDK